MKVKKWLAVSVTVGAVAAVAALPLTNPVRIFRTTSWFVGVSQGQNGNNQPQYVYTPYIGSNLVAWALGTNPTSNQVFAMAIDCGSSQAELVAFDKSNSNTTVIASSSGPIYTVKDQGLRSKFVNSERFVAQFTINPTNSLAGGSLMVAGRLHLGTNGCPATVLITLDRDRADLAYADTLADKDPDLKGKDKTIRRYRAGLGHYVGWLQTVSAGQTNTVLVPFGRLTFTYQLDQFNVLF